MHSSQPLNIHLIGWYGFNATGDDLIAVCIRRLLRECAQRLALDVSFDEGRQCHLAVLGGGTIIGCDSANIWPRIESISAPLAILGPGFRNMGLSACRAWRDTMREIFQRAVVAGVRGPLSAKQLREWGMASSADVIGDPAINFEPVATSPPRDPAALSPNSRPLVGICIRHLKQPGLEERYLNASATYDLFARLVPAVLQYFDADPVFFSFCENQFDSDGTGAERLRAMLPFQYRQTPILAYHPDPIIAASLIKHVDYLISERMHPSILMWSLSKPCIVIDYQYRKAEDFMSGLGMADYCLRVDRLDVERYMKRLEQLENARTDVVRRVRIAFAQQRADQQSLSRKALGKAAAYLHSRDGKSL